MLFDLLHTQEGQRCATRPTASRAGGVPAGPGCARSEPPSPGVSNRSRNRNRRKKPQRRRVPQRTAERADERIGPLRSSASSAPQRLLPFRRRSESESESVSESEESGRGTGTIGIGIGIGMGFRTALAHVPADPHSEERGARVKGCSYTRGVGWQPCLRHHRRSLLRGTRRGERGGGAIRAMVAQPPTELCSTRWSPTGGLTGGHQQANKHLGPRGTGVRHGACLGRDNPIRIGRRQPR